MKEAHLVVERIGNRGDGIALHEGVSYPLPYALPGETVRAMVGEGRADVLAIEPSSPERVAPHCRHFGQCGGCALQHWAAVPVAEWKRNRIRQALERVRIETDIAPTRDAHGAGRRRVTLHIRRHEGPEGPVLQAGFMKARSHQLVDLDSCPLLVPALAPVPDLARRIGHVLRGFNKPLDLQATASLDGLDLDLRGSGPLPEALRQKLVGLAMETGLARLTLHGERLIEPRPPRVAMVDQPGMTMFVPPGSFLQATAEAEAELAALAGSLLAGTKHLAELFCGLGPFGLRLARQMKVTAFDSDRPAIEAFQRSIRANPGGKPAVAEARDLFRRPLFAPELKPFDAVLLDPPRQGAEAQIREIAKSRLGRVAYVSCDPESFARDAQVLVAAGFRLTGVTPVDQFRHSPHVELVAGFAR
ncbi:MAG: RNA methyltransferase [Beijerinckiaceae bacterium]|nr:RNA methyltransferase [Beijerinckiaceae bacterium]